MRKDVLGVAVYLVLAFGLAWTLWEIPLRLGVPLRSGLFQVVALVGAFAPAMAAIIVRKWVTREGFADAGLDPAPRRWPYYLLALLIPLAAAFAVAVAAPALGIGEPDFSMRSAATVPGGGSLAPTILLLSAYSIVLTPVQWGEEFGWRGYLQLRLFARQPLLAAVATGIIWGVWHYPLLLRGTELPGHPGLILVLFPLGTVFYSVVLGWLRLRSGSVWTASLAHSAINHLRSPLMAILFASVSDKLALTLASIAVMGLAALLIVACGGLKPVPEPA